MGHLKRSTSNTRTKLLHPLRDSWIDRSDAANNTPDPTWNHTFVLSSADGLHLASYVTLALKEKDVLSGTGSDYFLIFITDIM